MNFTDALREQRTCLPIGPTFNKQVSDFVKNTLYDWQLPELVGPARCAAGELANWIIKQGASSPLALTATWDHDLLIVELGDRGGLVPDPHVSKADAELAMWLLDPPAVEWGAELDGRGRRLWVSFSTGSANANAPDGARDGWSEP